MTTNPPNDLPIPSAPPPTPPPSKPTKTSLTARLHLPTTYSTLPSHWLTTYQSYVRHNTTQITSLESTLRSLTYLLPIGTRVTDTPLASESLQTFLALLTAYNTHLLACPPFSPQRRYERFWEAKSTIYARCAALLRTIQYTQLLLEMLAKRKGEKWRWRVVVGLEVVKALLRLCMGRGSGGRPVIATGVGDDRSERGGDAMAATEDGSSVQSEDDGGEWKMPRTGLRLPALPIPSSSSSSSLLSVGGKGEGGGRGGKGSQESITAFLTSRAITPDDIKSAHRLVRTLHTLPAYLAESLYILRPVLYAIALQQCHANKKDWRPWLLGLSMELAARQLRMKDVEGSVVGGMRGLSGVEREEGKRRGWGLLWWGMRGAFYENATRGLVKGVVGRLKGRAVLDMVGVVVEDYDFLWGEYYFPTATL